MSDLAAGHLGALMVLVGIAGLHLATLREWLRDPRVIQSWVVVAAIELLLVVVAVGAVAVLVGRPLGGWGWLAAGMALQALGVAWASHSASLSQWATPPQVREARAALAAGEPAQADKVLSKPPLPPDPVWGELESWLGERDGRRA